MAREKVRQRRGVQVRQDGKLEAVWIRKCANCGCWFGTLKYDDQWCCDRCERATRTKIAEVKARIIKEIER